MQTCKVDLCGTQTADANGGYCSYHQRERAEAAEAIANTALSDKWRIMPDEDGECGETWRAAFADCDMSRMDAEARAEQLEAERDTAWTELRVIRKTIGADDDEATSDEVSRLFGKLTAERDEAQRQLEQARNREQMDRAVMTEASAKIDELRRQLEQAHAIIAEQSNTIQDATL